METSPKDTFFFNIVRFYPTTCVNSIEKYTKMDRLRTSELFLSMAMIGSLISHHILTTSGPVS